MMRKPLLILFIICLFSAPVLAKAQDGQPEQGFILGSSAEVIFPQAIRFSVTLSRLFTDLALASLIVQPEGQAPIAIDINLNDAALMRTPFSELAYMWQIPRDNPPHLFQDVTFTWRVTSNKDEVSQYKNSIVFTDQRAQWVQETDDTGQLSITIPAFGPSTEPAQVATGDAPTPSTPQANNLVETPVQTDATPPPLATGSEGIVPQFSVTASGPQPTTISTDDRGVNQLYSGLQITYDLLSTNTGQKPSFNLIIYTDAFPPGCTQNSDDEPVAIGPISGVEITCDETLATAIFLTSGYALVQSDSSSLNRAQVTLTYYLTDQFYEAAWSGKNVPEWFRIGLQQIYTSTLKTALYPTLLTSARNDVLIPLDDSTSFNSDVGRAQSYGLVVYIADQIGLQGLFKLANVDAGTFSDAYQSAMGKPLSSLLEDWKRWIFTDRAVSAFSFTVYQAATPTPTITRTPTPTATPMPTLTFTPTFTPTVTGVLTQTPVPTRTLTWTPLPAPPTRTPRPAGSLSTPTPVPPQAVNPVSGLSGPASAVGILTIGLVLIAIFALFLLRPRRK
jgi:hypothetical protein